MAIIVQKYGGTSVGDASRIKEVAARVEATRRSGSDVVVVVSAMGETTNQLVQLAAEITSTPPLREMDMLLTAGERVSMSLLAMALDVKGIPAVSYTGSQAGILTDSSHGEARIKEITGQRVRESLSDGKVVIVAGFQGVDPDRKEVTTLGRGGSDTTAVALAGALNAEACEILTDVGGVLTGDPRVIDHPLRHAEIGYHQMMALAVSGAAVLSPSSVEYAHRSGVRVHVRSSFDTEPGTWVIPEAALLELAGVSFRDDGETGRVTVVGTEAGAFVEEAFGDIEEMGISQPRPELGEWSVSIEVPSTMTLEVGRLLHSRLIRRIGNGHE